MNIVKARDILKQLAEQGVKTLCICPGARNAPFIQTLAYSSGFEILSFYDERSAGFFALGRARRDKAPVAILTTSGTAVSELLSPVIEAFYSNTPIVVLSSDRPKRLRGTGAPQAIEQATIFAPYVEKSWDISSNDKISIEITKEKPVHINVCFDEPLIDSNEKIQMEFVTSTKSFLETKKSATLASRSLEKTVVIVGGLKGKQVQSVEQALCTFQAPIFAEASSSLRESVSLKDRLLRGGDKLITKMLKSGEVKSVLRIGDMPLGRFWRDLDALKIPTISLSDKEFSGTEKSEFFHQSLEDLSLLSFTPLPWEWKKWQKEGLQKYKDLQENLMEFPLSEASIFKSLIPQIPANETVYIGNSLPVRLWDLVSQSSHQIFGNRGANGIDGQISSAFGLLKPRTKNWIVLGDLTTLYDFNGFWVSDYLRRQEISVNLLVINNGGGQIFSRIFSEELFRNQHQLSFEAMAKMWGWDYHSRENLEVALPQEGLQFIEVKPNQQQSQEFWAKYDRQWE